MLTLKMYPGHPPQNSKYTTDVGGTLGVFNCQQVVRISAQLVAEARRADSSLIDLLSVGHVVRVTASTSNRRVGDTAAGLDDVVLAQPATLTIAGPPSPATDVTVAAAGRGKLNVLTYRGGRVDATAECVPCAYDYSARRRRIDIRVWQLTGIGYTSVVIVL